MLGLQPKQAEEVLTFGTFWHEVMEIYRTGDVGDRFMAIDHIKEKAEDVGRFLDLLERYHDHWKHSYDGWKILGSECTLSAPVLAPDTLKPSPLTGYRGKLDKLIARYGELWVLDHKTTSSNLDQWRERNQYKPQGLSYCWLVKQVTGRYPRGIIYDVVHSKQPL